uniref:Essential protein Yae1 N-terminal domain-containing protein n=1 Tax=Arion vulgaris TaxID=1028688 RepID=A0A0B6Y8F7_9EUPU
MSSNPRDTALNQDDDIFHSVTMSEETSWQHGYTDGVEESRKKGYIEGYTLGTQKGTEIGKEVGFYAGFAAYWMRMKNVEDHNPRIVKVCETIIKLVVTFDNVQPTDELLTDTLNSVRGKFKQLSSLIGVPVQYDTVCADGVKGTSF